MRIVLQRLAGQNRLPDGTRRALAVVGAKAILRDNDGSSMIEFAMVAPLFLSLILATVQSGLIYFDSQTLQTAADRAARQIVIGNLTTGLTSAQAQAQITSIVKANLPLTMTGPNDTVSIDLQTGATFAAVSAASQTISYNSSGAVTNTFNSSTQAGACSVGVLKLYYLAPQVALIFPMMSGNTINVNFANSKSSRVIVATSVFKTEPFGGAQCT